MKLLQGLNEISPKKTLEICWILKSSKNPILHDLHYHFIFFFHLLSTVLLFLLHCLPVFLLFLPLILWFISTYLNPIISDFQLSFIMMIMGKIKKSILMVAPLSEIHLHS